MRLFSTILLVNTLRSLVEEIEQIDPSNAVLVQPRFTLNQQIARLAEAEPIAQFQGTT